MDPNQLYNQNPYPQQNNISQQTETPPVSQPTPQSSEPIQPQNITQQQTPDVTQNAVAEEVPVLPDQNLMATNAGPNQYIYLYILAVAVLVTIVFFWKRIIEYLKKSKNSGLPAEDDGTLCPTCGGTGKVKKKQIKTAPCKHCKETGIDICHHCGGTGRNGLGYGVPLEDIENYPKCDYCGGKGFPDVPLACCMCKGKRKEIYEESYEAPCETCKGSGKK